MFQRITFLVVLAVLAISATGSWALDPAEGYIGSSQCAMCHSGIFEKWETTLHSSIYRGEDSSEVDPEWVISDWSGEVTLSDSGKGIPETTFVLDSNGGAGPFMMTIKGTDQTFIVDRVHGGRSLERNEDPNDPDRPGHTKYIGKQRYHTKVGVGDNFMIMPMQWNPIPDLDGKNGGWVTYHIEDWISTDGTVNLQVETQPEERRCAGCHQTGVQVEYNEEISRYELGRIEPNIGCEACHGPGADHVGNLGDADAKAKMNPDNLETFEQRMGVCAQCHSRLASIDVVGPKTLGFAYANGRSFRPGDLVEDMAIDAGGYWAGGIAVSHHQQSEDYLGHGEFLGSAHAEAGMTCWTCHEPHGSDFEHDLKTTARDNSLCLGCHDSVDVELHSMHPASNDSSPNCVDCHMTSVQKSSVRWDIHQHSFQVMSPQLTLELAQPNACALCHREANGATDTDIAVWDDEEDIIVNTWLAEEFLEMFGTTPARLWEVF